MKATGIMRGKVIFYNDGKLYETSCVKEEDRFALTEESAAKLVADGMAQEVNVPHL